MIRHTQARWSAFTLVELLVGITVITILATLAFISLTRYNSQARDAVRGSDVKNISTILNLNNVRNREFPQPTNGIDITYSWATVWTQWVFGSETIRETGKIFWELKDPLYGNHYSYSVTNNRKEYQLWVYYESSSRSRDLANIEFQNPLQIQEAYASEQFNPLELNPEIWLDWYDIDGDGQTNDNPSNGGTITTWVNKSSAWSTNNPVVTHGTIQFTSQGLSGGYPGVFIANVDGLLLKNSDITTGDIFYVVQNRDPFWGTDRNGRGLQGTTKNMLIWYWWRYRNSLYISGSPSHYNSSPATRNSRSQYPFIYGFHTDGTNYSFRDVWSLISQWATTSISWQEWGFNKAGLFDEKADFIVSEILIFDSALSSSERQKVEWYLAHKWGQDTWLANSHPYKTNPPEASGPPPTPDSVPDTFTLSDVSNADLWQEYTSNPIIVSGINTSSSISISNGEYSINGWEYTSSPGTLSNNDNVVVRLTSSSSNETTISALLNIWWVTESYDVTTLIADITPDTFNFTPVNDADIGTQYSSNTITVSGLNTQADISVSWSWVEYKVWDGIPYDVTGSGIASTNNSNTGAGYSPQWAFDNNTSTTGWWNSNNVPSTLTYDLWAWEGKQVTKYTLYRDSSQSWGWWNCDSPKNWTFEWSNNGTSWSILDTRSNEYIQQDNPKKEYTITNSSIYRYYRINISASVCSTYNFINITQMELIDEWGSWSFTSLDSSVSNGDTVSLRMTSSSAPSTAMTWSLTIGTYSTNYTITTTDPDTTPDGFSFEDEIDAPLWSPQISNTITVVWINTSSPISITGDGWLYSINSWAFTWTAWTVQNGDLVRTRLIASNINSETRSTTLDIWWVKATYNVSTPAPPPDSEPDPFTFTNREDADISTEYISNTITLSWMNTSTWITIINGEYRIGDSGSFTSTAGTVSNGDKITVKNISSNTAWTSVNTEVTIWGIKGIYTITTVAPDTEPDVFSISDKTNTLINTQYDSDKVKITGINSPTEIGISWNSAMYSINDGNFTTVSGVVNNGDDIIVRMNSSSNWEESVTTRLTVGWVFTDFQITNGIGDSTPDSFVFNTEWDANLNTQYTSSSIVITWLTAPAEITIADGEYRVGATGSFTSSPWIIENNQEITLRHVSSIRGLTTKSTVVNIGWVSWSYTTTTKAHIPTTDNISVLPDSRTSVEWIYNGILVHAQNGDTHYILSTPSIIASDISNPDFTHIIQEKKLAYSGFENIPASYVGNDIDTGKWFDFTIRDPLLYEGTRQDIWSYSGLKQIDEGVKSSYWNFPAYSKVASYLDGYSLWYLETIIGSVIWINPIKPFYCSDILRSKLVSNIAPQATITASPSGFWSVWVEGIANEIISTEWKLDYEYHSADPNASIEFEWDTPQQIGLVRIYNRTECCSDRLTWAVIKLYNDFWWLIYSHPLWDTKDDYVISLDLEWIGHLHNVSKLTIETVWGNHLNLREVEIYLWWNIQDGVYKVDRDGFWWQSPYNVYCDMTTDGGWWTRIWDNYINNWNFSGQFHVDEHTFLWYNNVNDNLIVAHSTMQPPSYLPEAFVVEHNGTSSEAYPLYFSNIPWEFFAQEIRLKAWVKWTSGSIFQNTINYSDGSTVSSQSEYEVLEIAEDNWELHLARIPLEWWLVDDFTWDVWKNLSGPFYFTGLDMEVYYR